MELRLWTIYDHPTDMPDCFVARLFLDGQPTPIVLQSNSLELLRLGFEAHGLVCLSRSPEDDPKIVETWMRIEK